MKAGHCYLILRSMAGIMAVLIPCFLQGAFAQECTDVSGTWHVEETATITFDIDGETDTMDGSGSWDITIEQNGCDISFYTEGVTIEGQTIRLLREGTVTRDHITFSGQMGAVIPGASYSKNMIMGDGVIEGNVMTVSLTGEMNCTVEGIPVLVTEKGMAVFTRSEPVGFTLSAEVAPQEGGQVTVSPKRMVYSSGESVTLTALPANGYKFSGWSGDLTGLDNSAEIIMASNRSVTAHFCCNGSSKDWKDWYKPVGARVEDGRKKDGVRKYAQSKEWLQEIWKGDSIEWHCRGQLLFGHGVRSCRVPLAVGPVAVSCGDSDRGGV